MAAGMAGSKIGEITRFNFASIVVLVIILLNAFYL